MMHKVMNGYSIFAHHYSPRDGMYWILGSRVLAPGEYEYVIAGMWSFDLDSQWVTSGRYTTTLKEAFDVYTERVGY